MLAKILGFLVTCYLLLIPLAVPSFAQTSSPSAQAVIQLPTNISPTSPIFTDMLVNNMFHSFSCLAVGSSVIGQPCLTYQISKNAQGSLQSVPVLAKANLSGGTLGAVTGVIGVLYQNPPVRTVDYLATVGQDLGVVKEANAQILGSGQGVLNPILTLWQVSRNVSYVIMIIIFVIIGLMVMFRNRINPQTVITAQAALPGMVIGLILITFSYFLAGLISDTAFIGTNIVGYYFQAAQNQPPQDLLAAMGNRSVLSIFTPFTRAFPRGEIATAILSFWDDLAAPNRGAAFAVNPFDMDPQRVITNLSAMLVAQVVLPIGGLFGPIGQAVAGGLTVGTNWANPVLIVSFALSFVVIVVLIYAMFRLLLRLINSYLSIIFLTISAPFQFLFSALPGRQGIATNWILDMLSNVLAFPAVLAVLYFVAFLLGPDFVRDYCNHPNVPPDCPFKISQLNQTNPTAFVPTAQAVDANNSITGQTSFPLLGGFDLSFVRILLAFGALVALPSIPDVIARTIGRVSQAGQLIGQEIGAGTSAGQRYAGQFQSGIGGFAGQVGPLTSRPGYVMEGGQMTRIYDPRYGGQAGFWDKLTSWRRAPTTRP